MSVGVGVVCQLTLIVITLECFTVTDARRLRTKAVGRPIAASRRGEVEVADSSERASGDAPI